MLHRIFQAHHIPPDEVYAKQKRFRDFMYASELLVMEQEEEARKKQDNKQAKGRKKRKNS